MTALLRPSTKYGPDSEPVGSGVALSYSCPMSLPDRQEVRPAKNIMLKLQKYFLQKIVDGFFAKNHAIKLLIMAYRMNYLYILGG